MARTHHPTFSTEPHGELIRRDAPQYGRLLVGGLISEQTQNREDEAHMAVCEPKDDALNCYKLSEKPPSVYVKTAYYASTAGCQGALPALKQHTGLALAE